MIPKKELDKAIELAEKYNIGKLYLIGSSLYRNQDEVNDYDFAVCDVPPGHFFKFYGELMGAMSKDVDLIDISDNLTKLNKIIIREGKLVYEKTAA